MMWDKRRREQQAGAAVGGSREYPRVINAAWAALSPAAKAQYDLKRKEIVEELKRKQRLSP
jgi:hypothetical protein